jgi:acetyltransferase-like isoleucine patch superfamily enzyme
MRKKGVVFGSNISFAGCPIISVEPGSSMQIGSGSTLCSESRSTALGVNHQIVLRTLRPGATLKIGSCVRMSGTTICAAIKVTIEDNVCIGSNVMIADTDFHSLNSEDRSGEKDFDSAASLPVVIEHDVFIGAGAYILKGVTIGNNSIVGAGSVVVKSVSAWSIVAGNPAKIIGEVARP